MKQRGFTLFELLVTVSIIGILIAVITVSFSAAQRKGRDARRLQDMDMIAKAAEQFYALNTANYNYPADTTLASWTISGQQIIQLFPTDPKGVGWTPYTYVSPGLRTTFCACSALENSTGNANVTDCSAFVQGTGRYYCVKNQQ